jgi:DNA-binding NtrC family response regulator
LTYKEQLRIWEAKVISQAMLRTSGNQTAAARLLRMPVRTFTYKLKSHGLADKDWKVPLVL